jgi:hypothetical protein
MGRVIFVFIISKVPGLGALDEPYSAESAQRTCRTGPLEPCLAYVDLRAGTTTPLSGLS